ncbi:hypothetical protein MMC06_001865 [Schaereria dolodes]|nr:hypothetical protein [Schaereria dolodes]
MSELIEKPSVFFVPTSSSSITSENSGFKTILARLTSHYTAVPLSRWTLDHRLFRDGTSHAIPVANASMTEESVKLNNLRYLQILSLSHHPGQTHLAISTTYPLSQTHAGTPATSSSGSHGSTEPATIVSIPSGGHSEEMLQLMVSRLGPLWMQRHVLQVSNGQAFEIGNFRVRIGEVKQGQGGAQQVRGVIIGIEWTAREEYDWGVTEGVVKAFWDVLDIKGAREYIRVAGVEENFGSIRQWCEGLRLRA